VRSQRGEKRKREQGRCREGERKYRRKEGDTKEGRIRRREQRSKGT